MKRASSFPRLKRLFYDTLTRAYRQLYEHLVVKVNQDTVNLILQYVFGSLHMPTSNQTVVMPYSPVILCAEDFDLFLRHELEL
jgi:hypothetical protein